MGFIPLFYKLPFSYGSCLALSIQRQSFYPLTQPPPSPCLLSPVFVSYSLLFSPLGQISLLYAKNLVLGVLSWCQSLQPQWQTSVEFHQSPTRLWLGLDSELFRYKSGWLVSFNCALKAVSTSLHNSIPFTPPFIPQEQNFSGSGNFRVILCDLHAHNCQKAFFGKC